MRYSLVKLVLAMVVCVGGVGCLPGEEPAPDDMETLLSEASPEELVQEFTRMANDPAANSVDYRRFILVDQLAQMGSKTLSPIIALVSSPDSEPETRLFALQALVGRTGPQYMDELMPMLESEDEILRACAVTLLGPMEHPDAVAVLRAALEDESDRVSFSALSSLAVQGDPDSRIKLCSKYFEPDRHPMQKDEIVRVVLRDPVSSDVEILTDALGGSATDIETRAMVAAALGRVGDAKSIPSLEQSLTEYTEPVFVELASTALAALKEREGGAEGGAGR